MTPRNTGGGDPTGVAVGRFGIYCAVNEDVPFLWFDMDISSGEFPRRFDGKLKKDELMSAYRRLTLSFASNCARSCLSPVFLDFLAVTSFILSASDG